MCAFGHVILPVCHRYAFASMPSDIVNLQAHQVYDRRWHSGSSLSRLVAVCEAGLASYTPLVLSMDQLAHLRSWRMEPVPHECGAQECRPDARAMSIVYVPMTIALNTAECARGHGEQPEPDAGGGFSN